MALSSHGGDKLSKMGRPVVDTMAINVRMLTETVQRIDDARKKEPDLPNRPEMVRRMVDDWLSRHEGGDKTN